MAKISSFAICQVHHIDPKGQDSGVVYSEMQGRENTSGDLMSLRYAALSYLSICLVNYRYCTLDSREHLILQAVGIGAKQEGLWMLYVY